MVCLCAWQKMFNPLFQLQLKHWEQKQKCYIYISVECSSNQGEFVHSWLVLRRGLIREHINIPCGGRLSRCWTFNEELLLIRFPLFFPYGYENNPTKNKESSCSLVIAMYYGMVLIFCEIYTPDCSIFNQSVCVNVLLSGNVTCLSVCPTKAN